MSSESTTGHWLKTAGVALAIDLLIVFPISHTSIIGQFVTAASGAVVVPPLDYVALEVFGMEDPAIAAAEAAANQVADAGTAMAPTGGAAASGTGVTEYGAPAIVF